MSWYGDTYFTSDFFINLICDLIGNRRIFLCSCFQFLFIFLLREFCVFFGNGTFCNCKNCEAFACFCTFLDRCCNLFDIIRDFRNQDDICTACNTGMKSQASNFMSHDLYNKYTSVGRSRGVNTVNGIRRNIYRTLETKGHICAINVIVNCFRKVDNVQSFFSQKIGCFLRSVTAEDYETVEAEFIISLLHCFHFIQSVLIRNTHQLERLSGSSEDCSPLCQDS